MAISSVLPSSGVLEDYVYYTGSVDLARLLGACPLVYPQLLQWLQSTTELRDMCGICPFLMAEAVLGTYSPQQPQLPPRHRLNSLDFSTCPVCFPLLP